MASPTSAVLMLFDKLIPFLEKAVHKTERFLLKSLLFFRRVKMCANNSGPLTKAKSIHTAFILQPSSDE